MTEMKIGLVLPFGSSARSTAELAEAAEAAGWDGCFLGDAIWCEDPLIALTAAAMRTRRLRLGTLVLAAPLRRPAHLASESLALDRLSGGRLILGLGTGAAWMGWAGFPDEPTDRTTRAGKLEEMIDLLTRFYQREPFDYDGRYHHLKLTQVAQEHYPPRPVQQPRIPLWIPASWPGEKAIQRALRCDGVIVEKARPGGAKADLTPADVAALRDYAAARRAPGAPFDIVVEGQTAGLDDPRRAELLQSWQAAGVTWWLDGLWGETPEQVLAHIRRGPLP